jgi:NAD-dependent DNA ligase
MNIETLYKIRRTFVLNLGLGPKDPKKIKKAIQHLTLAKRYFSGQYEEGKSSLTDAEYDLLIIDTLKKLNPQCAALKETGADPSDTLVKVELPSPCGSLECLKPNGPVQTWVNNVESVARCTSYIITQKLDGITILLEYVDGVLINAYKRGNGVVGHIVLQHAKLMNIPQYIENNEPYMLVRGEAVMKEETFRAKYKGEGFKTSRNMVAGQFTRKDPNLEIMKDIDLVCYEIKESHRDKDIQLFLLKQFGFNVALNIACPTIFDEMLQRHLIAMREESPYLMDGLVIDICDEKQREALGFETNSNDPKYARSFKMALEENVREVKVVDIEWNVSKNGLVKPRIVLEPFEDNTGVTITHCTGKNARLIRNLGIGPGAVIRLIRSGDVIPDLLSVEKQVIPYIPTHCPSCGSRLGWTASNSKGEIDLINSADLICLNEECEGRAYKRVLAFFTGLEVEGFNKGTATKMVDAGYDIEEILRMSIEDIKALDGYAEMSAIKLYTNIKEACAKANLPTIMHATGLFGRSLGSTKLEAIIEAYEVDQLFLLTYSDIVLLPGFSDITAQAFMKGLTKFEIWWENNKKFFKLEKKVQKVESNKLNGQVILFTGFRDKILHEKIEKAGGTLTESMSKKVSLLVAKDPSENSTKIQKANSWGIKVISLEEFKNRL